MIVIDSDLSDEAIGNLTQAITHALRPGTLPPAPRTNQRGLPTGNNGRSEPIDFDVHDTEAAEEPEAETQPEPETPRSSSSSPVKRQFYKPKVLTDVDLKAGDKPFEVFAKEKAPTAITKRYLMIAAWFHEHANTTVISPDHVYTCYRALGWTLDIKDITQPFRDIKAQGWGDYKKKKFEINHVGLSQVQKMTAGSD